MPPSRALRRISAERLFFACAIESLEHDEDGVAGPGVTAVGFHDVRPTAASLGCRAVCTPISVSQMIGRSTIARYSPVSLARVIIKPLSNDG